MDQFEKRATTWDDSDARVKLASKVASNIMKRVSLDASHTLLDFGCGTGLVGLTLAPLVKMLVGADSSRAMLEIFQKKVNENAFDNAVSVEVGTSLDELSNIYRFDVVVSSMAFHHVQNPTQTLERLYKNMNKGGSICIADLDGEDGSFHGDNSGVYHFGFSKQTMNDLLTQSGFTHVIVRRIHTIEKNGRSYDILLSSGKKPF